MTVIELISRILFLLASGVLAGGAIYQVRAGRLAGRLHDAVALDNRISSATLTSQLAFVDGISGNLQKWIDLMAIEKREESGRVYGTAPVPPNMPVLASRHARGPETTDEACPEYLMENSWTEGFQCVLWPDHDGPHRCESWAQSDNVGVSNDTRAYEWAHEWWYIP